MTPYQRKQAIESVKIFRRKILSTDKCDREKTEAAIIALRQLLPRDKYVSPTKTPSFVWVESPRAFVHVLQEATKRDSLAKYTFGRKEYLSDKVVRTFMNNSHTIASWWQDERQEAYRYAHTLDFGSRISNMLDPARCLTEKVGDKIISLPLSRELLRSEPGQFEIDSMWMHHFMAEHFELSSPEEEAGFNYLRKLLAVASSCAFWWNHESAVFICQRPMDIHVDDRGRLHSTKGPAVEFWDGYKIYAICGIEMRKEIFENGKIHLQPETIDNTRNAEVRRVLMEMYGPDKYLKETGARVVHYGRDGRRLWLREQASDELQGIPLVMVELINSTPEPDGTHKHYFLRVLPHIRDADEAVASTFRLRAEDYRPQVET